LLRPAPQVDKVVAVIDDQLDLAIDALVGARPAELWLAQRRTGDR
jgi:hypothetical protein